MSVFAVVLQRADSAVSSRLEKTYPDNFRLSGTFVVVATDDVAQRVAEKVGIRGDGRVPDSSGVVIRLTSNYSGHTDRGLWDWFNKHKDHFS